MEGQVERAIEILRKGGIVAFPTDTIYGLGANALDEDAVLKVFVAKDRPRHLALTLLLADVSQISAVAMDIPQVTWKLAKRFLPGALTLVLNKAPTVSSVVTAGSEKVAVRVPDHPVPIALVRGLGAPITGTSANLSGMDEALTADEVERQMEDRVDFIISGERCPGGVASTVIDLTCDPPRILREGAISREKISKVCRLALEEG